MLKEQMKQNQIGCQPKWKSEISSYEPVDAETLLATPLPPVRWLIPDLLPAGLSLLAGASKTGKSWLCLWLCLRLAQGGEIWGRIVQPQTVLYLSLEDTPKRIQNRLSRLTEAPVPNRLYFQTRCEAIGEGLEFELELFLAKHPETGLIGVQPNQFTRKLAEYYYDVFLPKKIRYESRRTSEARMLFFFYDDDDGHDGDSGISPSKKGDSEKTSSSPSQEEDCADGTELVSQA